MCSKSNRNVISIIRKVFCPKYPIAEYLAWHSIGHNGSVCYNEIQIQSKTQTKKEV